MFTATRYKTAMSRNAGYAEDVHKWIMADKTRFNELEKALLFLHDRKAPIQQGRIHSELSRRRYKLSFDGDIFNHNRNFYPTLARYMRALHPDLKESARIRTSWIDEMELPAIPTGHAVSTAVNTGRTLSWEDWR